MPSSMAHVGPQIDNLSSEQLRRRIAAAGLCLDTGTDDWFPTEPSADHGRDDYERQARQACAGCEVRAECLILAMRYESQHGVKPHGIWGGTAPWERTSLARSRRRRRRVLAAALIKGEDDQAAGDTGLLEGEATGAGEVW